MEEKKKGESRISVTTSGMSIANSRVSDILEIAFLVFVQYSRFFKGGNIRSSIVSISFLFKSALLFGNSGKTE